MAVALLAQAGRRAFAFGFSAAFLASLVLELLNEGVLLEALGATSPLAVLLRLVTAMVLSFLPGTVFAYYLFATTTVSEFVAAFERLRLPQKVIIPFAVVCSGSSRRCWRSTAPSATPCTCAAWDGGAGLSR